MRIKFNFNIFKVDISGLVRVFNHFGTHLSSHKLRLLMSTASVLAASLMTVLQPWPLKIVFDYILLTDRRGNDLSVLSFLTSWDPMAILLLAAGLVLAIAILRGVFNYSHSVQAKIVGHRVVAGIRLQLFSHIQRLPQSYHDYRETGELMTRMTGDISMVQDLLVTTIITIGSQLILIASMLGIMFWLDWQMALIAVGVMPFFLLAAVKFTGRIKSSARHQREMYGKIVSTVQESFAGISQVKTYAQENKRERMIGRTLDKEVNANVKTTKLTANYARMVELIGAVGTCLVLWLGVQKAVAGTVTPGDLLIFLSYLRGIYRPLKSVARLTARVSKAIVRGEKLMEVLEMEPEVQEPEGAISAKAIKGDIRFEKVNFSYTAENQILSDFSCKMPKDKTTLIIGPTGAGKSTLAKLVLRLYEPTSGQLVVDDRPISDYRIRSLRKMITPLSQETYLFRMSVADNIAFGRRKAEREEIIEAAELVGADEFIRKLPKGYDTLLGEGGLTLSGGQRQRISFARATLRKSPVMIFDEPGTGLDVYAESEIKKVLMTLAHGRTMIIITHRLHFLELADWVVFIKNGHLIEQGPTKELMSKQSEFYQYCSGGDAELKDNTNSAISSELGLRGQER